MIEQNELIRKSITQDMQEGVLVLGLDGRIEYLNPAASDILGKSAEQMVGQKFASVFLNTVKMIRLIRLCWMQFMMETQSIIAWFRSTQGQSSDSCM